MGTEDCQVNVHEHGPTLPLVAVGDNRIGKVHSSTRGHRRHGRLLLRQLGDHCLGGDQKAGN